MSAQFTETAWREECVVLFDVHDAPDTRSPYSPQIFRPEKATVTLTRSSDKGTRWAVESVRVSGHRLLKSGSLGADIREANWHGFGDEPNVPDWLGPLVQIARERAVSLDVTP